MNIKNKYSDEHYHIRIYIQMSDVSLSAVTWKNCILVP